MSGYVNDMNYDPLQSGYVMWHEHFVREKQLWRFTSKTNIGERIDILKIADTSRVLRKQIKSKEDPKHYKYISRT